MFTVKFTLHDALSIVLECFLLICSLGLKLLLSKFVLQVSDLLSRFVYLLVLLLDLASKFSDLIIESLLV